MVSFSLTNAPATFMCLMNSVLCLYLENFMIVFINDIFIYSKNEEEHAEHMEEMLILLRKHQLYAKLRSLVSFILRFTTWDMLLPRK